MTRLAGSCLCGGVRFEVTDPLAGEELLRSFRSVAPWETLPDDGAERFDVRGP